MRKTVASERKTQGIPPMEYGEIQPHPKLLSKDNKRTTPAPFYTDKNPSARIGERQNIPSFGCEYRALTEALDCRKLVPTPSGSNLMRYLPRQVIRSSTTPWEWMQRRKKDPRSWMNSTMCSQYELSALRSLDSYTGNTE